MCVYGVAPDITGRFVLFVFKKKKRLNRVPPQCVNVFISCLNGWTPPLRLIQLLCIKAEVCLHCIIARSLLN